MARVYFEYLYNIKNFKELGYALDKINLLRNQEYKNKFLKQKLAILIEKRKIWAILDFLFAIVFTMKHSLKFIFKKLDNNSVPKLLKISTSKIYKNIESVKNNFGNIKNKYYLELVFATDSHKAAIQSQLIANKFNIYKLRPFANKKVVDFFLHADLKTNFNEGLGRGYAYQSFFKYFPIELRERKLKTEFSKLIKNYSLKLGEEIGEIPKDHILWKYVDLNKFEKLENELKTNPFSLNHLIYKRTLSLKLWLDTYFN